MIASRVTRVRRAPTPVTGTEMSWITLQQADICTSLEQLTVSDGTHLSADQTRAVVFVKLLELATSAGTPRLAVLRFLIDALNANCVPRLPASDVDAPALVGLADALMAGAGVSLAGEHLTQALATAGLQPPGLTAAERAAMCSGSAPSVALAALAVARCRSLVPLADGVAALSCEVRCHGRRENHVATSRC